MLETILDPELGIDIWTMGLIYDMRIKSDKEIDILMTFTTPVCPYGPALKGEVEDNLRALGFETIRTEMTFDPPWRPPPGLRAALGLP